MLIPSRYTRRTVWLRQAEWPPDTDLQTFICSAVRVIGERRFGPGCSAIRGAGLYSKPLPELPALASPEQLRELRAFVRARFRGAVVDVRDPDVWKIVAPKFNARAAELRPGWDQFQWIIRHMSGCIDDGRLTLFLRHAAGQVSQPVETRLWQTGALGDPFKAGFAYLPESRMSPEMFAWVFVDSAQLSGVVAEVEHLNEHETHGPISPVLRVGDAELMNEYEKFRQQLGRSPGRKKTREWGLQTFPNRVAQKTLDELASNDATPDSTRGGRPRKIRK